MQGSFKGLLNKFQRGLKRVPRMIKDISGRVFPECFKGGLMNFQENILGVLKNFHDAWHSSQLLEQKEGLFIRMIKEYII